ncbi:MAG: hypothetical protein J5497_06525, partial [Selenomonadaceae bacterium]|nr:hypothetical protein [Selenomonadaceae bacterium]
TFTATFDTANHYVFDNGDGTYTLADENNTTDYPELTQVYVLTLNGVEVSGGDPITIEGTNYYRSGATVTVSAKTGYTVTSSTATIDSDKTFTATFDTANHYVFDNGDGTYTLADENNTTDYPELTQVYALTLPSKVNSNIFPIVTSEEKCYYFKNTQLTFNAGTGAAVKPVTLENADIEITQSDIFYTVTVTDGFQIIADNNNIYSFNGTTYYRYGAQLTLKRVSGTDNSVKIGGENFDLDSDGTYSFNVGGVTEVTGIYIGRDPTMADKTFTLSITPSSGEATTSSVYLGTDNTLYSDSGYTTKIDWLTYDGNKTFTLTDVPTGVPAGYTLQENAAISITDSNSDTCTLNIGEDAYYGNGATLSLENGTLTVSGEFGAGFYRNSSNEIKYKAKNSVPANTTITNFSITKTDDSKVTTDIGNYITVSTITGNDTVIVVKQAAINDGVTMIKANSNDNNFFVFADGVKIDGKTPSPSETPNNFNGEWQAVTGTTGSFTYYSGSSSYSQSHGRGTTTLNITSAAKFTISVLPTSVTANNITTVDNDTSLVAINEAFLNNLTSTTKIELTNKPSKSYSLSYSGNVSNTATVTAIEEIADGYKCTVSAYKTTDSDGSFIYHPAQEFTITGLQENLTISNGSISGVTLTLNGDIINITLTAS